MLLLTPELRLFSRSSMNSLDAKLDGKYRLPSIDISVSFSKLFFLSFVLKQRQLLRVKLYVFFTSKSKRVLPIYKVVSVSG